MRRAKEKKKVKDAIFKEMLTSPPRVRLKREAVPKSQSMMPTERPKWKTEGKAKMEGRQNGGRKWKAEMMQRLIKKRIQKRKEKLS
jgi:hypothetical protein